MNPMDQFVIRLIHPLLVNNQGRHCKKDKYVRDIIPTVFANPTSMYEFLNTKTIMYV